MRRIIAMVDMDAFFASVEQAENPELKGLPIAVGSSKDRKGIVATCSYEARAFGVHSAMPSFQAKSLCPDLIFVPPNFETYRRYSDVVRTIFLKHTRLVEFASIDEAYLDLTNVVENYDEASSLMRDIKDEIETTLGVTATCGIGRNKFVAKIASDIQKPNGLTCIRDEETQTFLDNLPIKKFRGVGSATLEVMLGMDIKFGIDLRKKTIEDLEKTFGEKRAKWFYDVCRGIDDRRVEIKRSKRKSINVSKTYMKDVKMSKLATHLLAELIMEACLIAKSKNIEARTFTVKIKYNDFSVSTRSRTIENFTNEPMVVAREIGKTFMYNKLTKPVRLFGVTLSNLYHNDEIGLW